MAGSRALLAGFLPLLLAAACAAPGPYPSLAPRPAEKAYADDADERKPTVQPDDPALVREIDRLVAEARAGSAEFEAAIPAAQAAAGAAGGSGSDSWIEAQQALSRLEAARARTTAALADLDRLAVERASAGTLGEGDAARLRSATEQLQALADAQAERLRRVGESLNRL
jgi:acetylornithine deacetylase/succinyl-diaminopimelate desuccinylase-like protein